MTTPVSQDNKPIFDGLSGLVGIDAVVDELLTNVLPNDERLKGLYSIIADRKAELHEHLVQQLTIAARGGPDVQSVAPYINAGALDKGALDMLKKLTGALPHLEMGRSAMAKETSPLADLLGALLKGPKAFLGAFARLLLALQRAQPGPHFDPGQPEVIFPLLSALASRPAVIEAIKKGVHSAADQAAHKARLEVEQLMMQLLTQFEGEGASTAGFSLPPDTAPGDLIDQMLDRLAVPMLPGGRILSPALIAVLLSAEDMPDSLYWRLGGVHGTVKFVKDLTQKLILDPTIGTVFVSHLYDSNLMQRLIEVQIEQVSELTGGPFRYRGGDMQVVHGGLEITEEQFEKTLDYMKECLTECLKSSSLSEEDKEQAKGEFLEKLVEPYRGQIVRSSAPELPPGQGLTAGVVSDFTCVLQVKQGQEMALREALDKASQQIDGGSSPLYGLKTVHYLRMVLLDGGSRLLFAADYDGVFQDLVHDIADNAAPLFDSLFSFCQIGAATQEGYPGKCSTLRKEFADFLRRAEIKGVVFYSSYADEFPNADLKEIRAALEFHQSMLYLIQRVERGEKLDLVAETRHQMLRAKDVAAGLERPAPGPAVALSRQLPGDKGKSAGGVTEFAMLVPVKPENIALVRQTLLVTHRHIDANASPISRLGTVQNVRALFLDDGARLFLASEYDGTFQDYMDDFIDRTGALFDGILSKCEDIRTEGGKIVKYQNPCSVKRVEFGEYLRTVQLESSLFYSGFTDYPGPNVKMTRAALRFHRNMTDLLERIDWGEKLDYFREMHNLLAAAERSGAIPESGMWTPEPSEPSVGRELEDSIEQHLDDIQGIILRDYRLAVGVYLFVRIGSAEAGRRWLEQLGPRVTSTAAWDIAKPQYTVNVALNHEGLRNLGALPQKILDAFPEEFRVGMAEPKRTEMMGDTGVSGPANWHVGGTNTGSDGQPSTVHGLVVFQAGSDAELAAAMDWYNSVLRAVPEVQIVYRQDAAQLYSNPADWREHFGFRDGIAEPFVKGSKETKYKGQDPELPAGEFILGYRALDTRHEVPVQLEDLCKNGSYLVLRKLYQDVFAFRKFLKKTAKPEIPGSEELLAAKMVGRWRSGAPLIKAQTEDDPALGADPTRNNDFNFDDDKDFYVVPAGAHIRRGYPRGSSTSGREQLHRIMRRGMPYGKPLPADAAENDSEERGIVFVFVGASIANQFEFVQREWMNGYLLLDPVRSHDTDPMVGDNQAGTMWIPQKDPELGKMPFEEEITGLPRFVTVKGGGYFFVPGIEALKVLAREVTE